MHMHVHTHTTACESLLLLWALVPAEHAADLVKDANKETFRNLKKTNGKKIQASLKGSFYRLNILTEAASDIISCISVRAASSEPVLIHIQVCSFRL